MLISVKSLFEKILRRNMITIRRVLVLVFSFLFKTSYSKIIPLIQGGSYASIKVYPYAAYLDVKTIGSSEEEAKAHCGASILNQVILLTAAHCVYKEDKNSKIEVFATVGHSNITRRKKHRVSGIKIHEKFSYVGGSPGDIAVLKLEKPLKFGKKVRRVAIMKSPPYNGPASVAGWGDVDNGGTETEHLKHITGLEVWSRKQCIKRYKLKKTVLPKGVLCSGYYANSSQGQTSGGDSGSALIVRDYIQIGVVSFTYISLENGSPPQIVNLTYSDNKEYDYAYVYTDVGFYYDWILKNIKELYCENS